MVVVEDEGVGLGSAADAFREEEAGGRRGRGTWTGVLLLLFFCSWGEEEAGVDMGGATRRQKRGERSGETSSEGDQSRRPSRGTVERNSREDSSRRKPVERKEVERKGRRQCERRCASCSARRERRVEVEERKLIPCQLERRTAVCDVPAKFSLLGSAKRPARAGLLP